MPTYRYECQACGHTLEAFQSMTEKPIRVCPECKSRRVRRLIGTGAAIIFKGSGFYQTDYRSSEYNESKRKDTDSSSNSSSSSSSTSDSKSTSDAKSSKSADKKKKD